MASVAMENKWVSGIGGLFLCPEKFFERVDPEAGIRVPLLFLLGCAVTDVLLTGLLAHWKQPLPYMVCFSGIMIQPVVMTLLLFLAARVILGNRLAIEHVFTVVAYANGTLLLSWIPGFAFLASLWSYYLVTVGLSKVGKTGGWRAAGCVVAACLALFAVAALLGKAG